MMGLMEESFQKKGRSHKSLFLIILFLILAAIPVFYFYSKYQKSNNPGTEEDQVKSLVGKVGVLIELPKEAPKVATVSDKEKLKDQVFFANAQNGDKVLIFTQAKKAILYRPAINKIIEVAPVNLESSQASSSTPISKIVRVAIYNGTKITGLASVTEKQIKDKIANIEVVKKDNAKGDYNKTLIVDLTGANTGVLKQITSILKGETGALPKIEIKPDAD